MFTFQLETTLASFFLTPRAWTQKQALSALLFMYRHVIGRDVGDPGNVMRARKPGRLPVVMTRDDVKAVLIMFAIMYNKCYRMR